MDSLSASSNFVRLLNSSMTSTSKLICPSVIVTSSMNSHPRFIILVLSFWLNLQLDKQIRWIFLRGFGGGIAVLLACEEDADPAAEVFGVELLWLRDPSVYYYYSNSYFSMYLRCSFAMNYSGSTGELIFVFFFFLASKHQSSWLSSSFIISNSFLFGASRLEYLLLFKL